MKIIYNKLIPFKGFCAVTLGKWIFARMEYMKKGLSKWVINHENVHMLQQDDFIIPIIKYIIFYIWYLLEWIIKLPCELFGYSAYSSISFEQEAYNNQYNLEYIKTRKKFNWLKYIFKFVKK